MPAMTYSEVFYMKRHLRKKDMGLLGYLLEGGMFAVAAFALLSFVFAAAACLGGDPTSMTGMLSAVALILSFFAMGIFISLKKGEGSFMTSLICALALVALLLIGELIIKRGAVSIAFLINCLCAVGASLLGPAVIKKRRRIRRIR